MSRGGWWLPWSGAAAAMGVDGGRGSRRTSCGKRRYFGGHKAGHKRKLTQHPACLACSNPAE